MAKRTYHYQVEKAGPFASRFGEVRAENRLAAARHAVEEHGEADGFVWVWTEHEWQHNAEGIPFWPWEIAGTARPVPHWMRDQGGDV